MSARSPRGKVIASGRERAIELGMPNGRYGPTVADARVTKEEYLDQLRADTLARVRETIARLVDEGTFPSARVVSKAAGCSPNLFNRAPHRKIYRDKLAKEQHRFTEVHPEKRVRKNQFIDHEDGKQRSATTAARPQKPCRCPTSERLRSENAELKRQLGILRSEPLPRRPKIASKER